MGRFIGKSGNLGGVQALPQSFVTSKNEGPILDDGASQSEAKLVPLEGRNLAPLQGIFRVAIKEVSAIQGAVTVKVKHTTVEFIGSGFGDGADHASRESAILGTVGTGDDPKFANGVHPQQTA